MNKHVSQYSSLGLTLTLVARSSNTKYCLSNLEPLPTPGSVVLRTLETISDACSFIPSHFLSFLLILVHYPYSTPRAAKVLRL